MTKQKDLTEDEFQKKLAQYGMHELPGSSMGFVAIGVGGTHVSRNNGGQLRRSQLAYLLTEQERCRKNEAVVERKKQQHREMIQALMDLPATSALSYAVQVLLHAKPWTWPEEVQPKVLLPKGTR